MTTVQFAEMALFAGGIIFGGAAAFGLFCFGVIWFISKFYNR